MIQVTYQKCVFLALKLGTFSQYRWYNDKSMHIRLCILQFYNINPKYDFFTKQICGCQLHTLPLPSYIEKNRIIDGYLHVTF